MNENNNDEEAINENINETNESENEDLNQGRINELTFKYNSNEFEKENIIKILLDSNLIYNKPKCDKCQSFLNLTKNKKNLDGYMWRCKKKGLNSHDSKKNIRVDNIFENIQSEIRIL